MDEKLLTMDKKRKELDDHFIVVTWLRDHWNLFPDNLFQRLENGTEIPFSVQAYILNLLRGDLADILTISRNWREIAAAEGVELPK